MLRLAILAACAALVAAERGDIDLDVEETDHRVIIVDDDPSRQASALQESGTVGKQIRMHTAVKVDAMEFAKLDVEERIRQAREKGLTWRDVDLPCDCADEPAPGPGDSPTPSPAAPTPAAPTPAAPTPAAPTPEAPTPAVPTPAAPTPAAPTPAAPTPSAPPAVPTPAPAPGPPPQTCEQQHNNQACKGQFGKLECHTCKERIDWVAKKHTHGNVEEAKDRIAMEFLADCGACAKNPVQLGHGYETVFRDDFDGDKLDQTKWKFYTDRNFNSELQQYTNREPQNAEVGGGTLKIHAKKERFSGKAGNMRFTAARIDSKEAWTYGRFSFKARMSHTQVKGTWPALWMLPQGDDNWPDSGEIDIMENVGYEGDVIHGTPHTGKYNHIKGSQRGGKIKCKVTDWHVYAVEWTPTRVLWALDGKPYHLFDKESDDNAVWPFTKDFFLIMNFAVGGDWGGVKGVAEQMFEGQGLHMEVDWALVEQQKPGGDAPGPAPPAPTVPTPSAGPTPLPPPSPTPSAGGGETVMVMSYNTEYKNYRNRVRGYGAKIKEVGPAVVGAQECQDKRALARESGLTNVPNTDFQNPIFYDPKKVTLVTSGWMPIKRDKYSKRTVTWAQFKVGQSTFWFFNTHLPHNHGESANTWTHHGIVHHIMEKRKELGAANSPTVIVGDTNPHASHGAKSFEKTLVEDFGFILAYSSRGDKGGLKGYDKIFASKEHFAASNGRDHGTGGSDHPAVTVDLTFK